MINPSYPDHDNKFSKSETYLSANFFPSPYTSCAGTEAKRISKLWSSLEAMMLMVEMWRVN
jgi:hypothetical protein